MGDIGCLLMAQGLYRQLGTRAYTWPMAVLELEQDYDCYLETLRTARKRAAKARKRGYQFDRFERANYQRDVNEINQSKRERQGRPMNGAYLQTQAFTLIGEQPCDRHRITSYGIFDRFDTLVAYTVIHRCGELALVSQILGHGDHEPDGVMQLLGVGTYRMEQPFGGALVYNRWDSGQDGLRQAKEWLRYQPMEIAWRP